MRNILKPGLLGFLFLAGCLAAVKTPFVPMDGRKPMAAKPPSAVRIIFDASKVPFPYVQLGHVYSESTPDRHQSAKDQILTLRGVAAANGADAVIISKIVIRKAGAYKSVEGGITHLSEIAIYSGIAIVETPVNDATPQHTPTVSTGVATPSASGEPADVQVFSDPSQVPYPYIPIGEIIPVRKPGASSAADQINEIRAQAAAEGADGVIISYKILEQGGTYRSSSEGTAIPIPVVVYSGIAISSSGSGAAPVTGGAHPASR